MKRCSVEGCNESAAFEVLLYDRYSDGVVFCEQDFTCPYLCERHQADNEAHAQGERRPRGFVSYPFTNQEGAQGFTKYRAVVDA